MVIERSDVALSRKALFYWTAVMVEEEEEKGNRQNPSVTRSYEV